MPADTVTPDNEKQQHRLSKLIDLLKSWKGEKPDYDNLDFSNWHQTEAEYQKEQSEWLKKRKKRSSSGESTDK
ncbi:MAG: hypothetical protein SWH61_06745 [Thermodesulfobacteriota bacterium]|nr:hypothetical protein [Thermodesulfobacteriota bacterium]